MNYRVMNALRKWAADDESTNARLKGAIGGSIVAPWLIGDRERFV